jgi:RecG-like helicase
MGEQRGWLGRALHRWTAPQAELEAEDLQGRVEKTGATAVRRCPDRGSVCVSGSVRAVTMRLRAGAPTVEVELYDGSGSVTLVFLGRRRIRGIEVGRHLMARGRVSRTGAGPVIYNPAYDLLPADYVADLTA